MLNIQPKTISRCHKYLNNMGDINQKSVQNLPQEVKQFLRQVTPKRLKELAQMNCFAAEKVKSELDKQYGQNNWIMIAIGRSLSSIAETLGKMGINIKILPLSQIKQLDLNSEWVQDELNIYKAFLNFHMGLSKYDLEKNKDKKFIIMDYAYTGESIKKAEELLRKDDFLGDSPNLLSKTINEILGKDFKKRKYDSLYYYERFKDYSYVGKLRFGDYSSACWQSSPEYAEEYQGNITQGLRKLFWFNVFDSIKEQDYEDIIPKSELKAIYQHKLSPKVLQKHIKEQEQKLQYDLKWFKSKNKPEQKIAELKQSFTEWVKRYTERKQKEADEIMKVLEP